METTRKPRVTVGGGKCHPYWLADTKSFLIKDKRKDEWKDEKEAKNSSTGENTENTRDVYLLQKGQKKTPVFDSQIPSNTVRLAPHPHTKWPYSVVISGVARGAGHTRIFSSREIKNFLLFRAPFFWWAVGLLFRIYLVPGFNPSTHFERIHFDLYRFHFE